MVDQQTKYLIRNNKKDMNKNITIENQKGQWAFENMLKFIRNQDNANQEWDRTSQLLDKQKFRRWKMSTVVMIVGT